MWYHWDDFYAVIWGEAESIAYKLQHIYKFIQISQRLLLSCMYYISYVAFSEHVALSRADVCEVKGRGGGMH